MQRCSNTLVVNVKSLILEYIGCLIQVIPRYNSSLLIDRVQHVVLDKRLGLLQHLSHYCRVSGNQISK